MMTREETREMVRYFVERPEELDAWFTATKSRFPDMVMPEEISEMYKAEVARKRSAQ
jgi:hypothetical protein